MEKFYDSTTSIPEPIKRAIEHAAGSHVRTGDISVTEVMDSPLMFWLNRNKKDQLTVDYATRIYALLGTTIARVLEEHGGEFAEVHHCRALRGVKISGSMDLAYDAMTQGLHDYKLSSVFVAGDPKGPIMMKHEQQVNIYRWLLQDSNPELFSKIKALYIDIILRDWGPRFKDKFPVQFKSFQVRMWPIEEVESFLINRLLKFMGVLESNKQPPICKDSDRWMRDFAVIKKGAKRATKAGFDTYAEAFEYINVNHSTSTHEVRDAKPNRCLQYCDYAKCDLCPYFKMPSDV